MSIRIDPIQYAWLSLNKTPFPKSLGGYIDHRVLTGERLGREYSKNFNRFGEFRT